MPRSPKHMTRDAHAHSMSNYLFAHGKYHTHTQQQQYVLLSMGRQRLPDTLSIDIQKKIFDHKERRENKTKFSQWPNKHFVYVFRLTI